MCRLRRCPGRARAGGWAGGWAGGGGVASPDSHDPSDDRGHHQHENSDGDEDRLDQEAACAVGHRSDTLRWPGAGAGHLGAVAKGALRAEGAGGLRRAGWRSDEGGRGKADGERGVGARRGGGGDTGGGVGAARQECGGGARHDAERCRAQVGGDREQVGVGEACSGVGVEVGGPSLVATAAGHHGRVLRRAARDGEGDGGGREGLADDQIRLGIGADRTSRAVGVQGDPQPGHSRAAGGVVGRPGGIEAGRDGVEADVDWIGALMAQEGVVFEGLGDVDGAGRLGGHDRAGGVAVADLGCGAEAGHVGERERLR